MVKPRVFMNFTIDGEPVGRVVYELFTDTAPKTCENFRALCTGERGISDISQIPLYYKGSIVHRAVSDFMIQAGDFTKGNGTGGESIYGPRFDDEDLERPIGSEGLLVMANRGPNTNSSQFFVTLRPCPHLDGKHVCFGRVVSGYDVIVALSEVPVDGKDKPIQKVVIASCGELEFRKPAGKQTYEEARNTYTPAVAKIADSDDDSVDRQRKRRHASEDSEEQSEDDERRRKKERKSKRKDKTKEKKHSSRRVRTPSRSPIAEPQPAVPREETEEELDERLEREEMERIKEAKRVEVERLKKGGIKPDAVVIGGIRYKGRGAMKYRDPESDPGYTPNES